MEQHPIRGNLPAGREEVVLRGKYHGKYRVFAGFLICCGFLIEAFAATAIWMQRGGPLFAGGGSEEQSTEEGTSDNEGMTSPSDGNGENGADEVIPAGAIPIFSMDLSYSSLGESYIHNETAYSPNVGDLLGRRLDFDLSSDGPRVLILHTHTTESYLDADTAYITQSPGDLTYSQDSQKNILSVGEVLCRALNEKGITALHCTVMHDTPSLSGAYARAAETVKYYLEKYPSIMLVIDLHRDAVMTPDGAYVRSAAPGDEGDLAQVMAVVGTDGNGTLHPNWENNLALALQLKEKLNLLQPSVSRPVSLRNASFNQELAEYALLLEIGTGANSLEAAKRAAILVAEALAALIQGR